MKLRLSLLLTAFSSIATTSYAKTNTPKSVTTKMENFHKTQQFVNAMKQSQQSNLRRASIRKLKSNLLLHAKPTPANHRDLDQNNDYYVYDNNNNNTDDDNANANANDGYYQSNNAYGDGNGDDNADDEYGNYGFDISSYSLKYASCSTVSTFSDDLAEDEDSTTVFYKQQFVIFRLCPSDYCTNGGNGSSGDRSSSSNPFVKYFNSNSNSNDNANANGDGADGDGSGENTSSEKFGCMNNYGEYMIPLADWLDIIGAYRQEEMERYCAFCDACVGGYYNDDGENGGGDDGDDYGAAANNGNKYYNYADLDDYVEADDANANNNNNNNNGNDDGGDQGDGGEEGEGEGENGEGEGEGENGEGEGEGENGEGEDRKLEGNNYDCSSNTSACSGYGDICYNNDQVDWSQFFGCQKMNFNDDTILYVGAHCARDKHTIVLAAFEDEYCQSYVGDHYDLATITDDAVATDSLEEYFRSDCISCKESDLPFQEQQDEDNDDISEICENLYDYSAKCNMHIGGANDNSYQSYQQANNEYAVCSFISSVVTGTYDEYGYIYIDSNEYSSDNKYNSYAEAAIRKDVVTAGQAVGLIFMSIGFALLVFHAAITRSQVQQRGGFDTSTRQPLSGKIGGMKRQDSGIMICRSKSNISYRAPSHTEGKLV